MNFVKTKHSWLGATFLSVLIGPLNLLTDWTLVLNAVLHYQFIPECDNARSQVSYQSPVAML